MDSEEHETVVETMGELEHFATLRRLTMKGIGRGKPGRGECHAIAIPTIDENEWVRDMKNGGWETGFDDFTPILPEGFSILLVCDPETDDG